MKRIAISMTAALAAALLCASLSRAQLGGGAAPPPADSLVRISVAALRVPAGGSAAALVQISVARGWHVNANPPSPDYMIPTEVVMTPAGGVSAGRPAYPAPVKLKVGFEQSALLTYGGRFTVSLPVLAGAKAALGAHVLAGEVRFQACNDQVCLTPTQVSFKLPVEVTGPGAHGAGAPVNGSLPGAGVPSGAAHRSLAVPESQRAPGAPATPEGTPAPGSSSPASAATPEGTPAPTPPGAGATSSADTGAAPVAGFATAPPSGAGRSAALDNPIARALLGGGFAAFLTLFLVGLALNLTPCVYPMLGVTVSIFGARRADPPLQVFRLALLYVLGMALMYSTLGVVAALTGGLFGAFLQNPIVLVGIGVLMIALALSMFGLYQLQMPAALLSRLGGSGATSAAGIFLSGLVVGVFAAPCVGPPVVALLAVVGAKGDPWFGFATFFTLSMGLGAPYLVLGTFSNLLQRLPRSGEWMVWVERLFGVVLLGVGLFYGMLGVAPKWAGAVIPLVLMAGGLYLGFFQKSAHRRGGFRLLKFLVGAGAIAWGLLIVATLPARGIEFRHATRADLQAALERGRPVMLDFSADWCVPCHELERMTFTHPSVIETAKGFEAFKVDLTRFGSPESEAWRKDFAIAGVPTVVFLGPDGREVRAARVEGYLAPPPFVERMRLAAQGAARAARE